MADQRRLYQRSSQHEGAGPDRQQQRAIPHETNPIDGYGLFATRDSTLDGRSYVEKTRSRNHATPRTAISR